MQVPIISMVATIPDFFGAEGTSTRIVEKEFPRNSQPFRARNNALGLQPGGRRGHVFHMPVLRQQTFGMPDIRSYDSTCPTLVGRNA
jgi:hypothetical protein